VVDGSDHKVTYANPAALRMIGRPKEQVVGSVCHSFVCPAEVGKCPITDLGLAMDNAERWVINARGERVPVIKTVVPTTIGGRKYLMESFLDITERKQMEQRVLSERLKAIEQLAGMVGHDLRTPLQGISGAIGALRGRLDRRSDKIANEMIELIEKNVDYSDRIIRDLSDYSGEIHLETANIGVKSILRDALTFVTFPSNIMLVDMTQDDTFIDADPDKLKRVFINLLKNAMEAMPAGGRVTVASKQSSSSIEIVFADTGVGMTEDILKKIWVPLFTTKSRGMGFGLAICKRIVEAHGGRVSAISSIGEGSTITVSLPIRKIRTREVVWKQ
jgi:PAS domain S-box-containing protein